MVIQNIVLKFNNVDVFYTICYIFDLSSALAWHVVSVKAELNYNFPDNSLVLLGGFFGDAPPQVHLVQIDATLPCARPQLGEHKPCQQITLAVHVTECGRDENAGGSPPEMNKVNNI